MEKFYDKVGKIDILIDDGGHTNLQQITTLMESIDNMNYGGVILIEDTHTSFMNYKGFKNPSKNSFINFSTNLIENLHRRNPMTKKKMNKFSKKIYSIEYFDSITLINIIKKKIGYSKNLQNNNQLNSQYIDYRFKRPNVPQNDKKNSISSIIISKVSKKDVIPEFSKNIIGKQFPKKQTMNINKYLKIIKKK